MDFFNGFTNEPKRTSLFSVLMTALLGAVLGGLLVAFIIFQFINPNAAKSLPDPVFPQESNDTIPYTQRDLPEYQNTAIVHAVERVLPTVVGITNKAMNYDFFHGRTILAERATGTGVIIDQNGYIVTNNHVVDGAYELSVTLSNGEEIPALLVGADPATDLAVVKIEKSSLPTAQMGNSDNLAVGEAAIAIGNPLGIAFSQTVTVGVISAKERAININEHNFNFIQTDAAINDGNSGGPLVNLNGEVIGINTAKIKISGVEGMGFAIPSNTVKMISRDLIRHGRIIRPWIGVYHGGDVDESLAAQLQLPVTHGVLIQDVVANGPAQRAGIRRGDVIVAMAGQNISKFSDMRRIIFEHEVGDEIEVTFFRDRQEQSVTIRLAELPESIN